MRLLGILGGMSWTSTEVYYRLLNTEVAARLGGLHSARLLLHSVDFDEVAEHQHAGDWDAAGAILGDAARGLAAAGAEALVLATNTMHKVAGEVERASGLPLIHIADVSAAAVTGAGLGRVGLLATSFTMEDPFYVERLASHGVTALVPEAGERAEVHRIIYDELCHGVVNPASGDAYAEVMAHLVDRGAEAILLGCTEIGLLVGPDDVDVPTFDSTALHVAAAVDWALDEPAPPAGSGNAAATR